MYRATSPSWINRSSLLRLALCGLLLVLFGGGSAWAASPSDEGCNQDEVCRGLFVKGKTLYKDQDYSAALKMFMGAYERRQTPILLINIGRTLQKLGRPKEALDYYQRCQEAAKTDNDLQEKLAVYIAETKALIRESPTSSEPTQTKPDPTAEPAPQPLSEPLTPLPPKEENKPVYKKGWFWAVVVTGVLVVGGAVATGVYFGTRPAPDPMLDPDVVGVRPMF
ncbi:MAG TPA: tetratricopeptide repeat protein [Pseudomonadota bacterium]|nr:tetratricopeptide repeat protein [Pseudomonadota bacterium]